MIVVMKADTGELLSYVSIPDFNPNMFQNFSDEDKYNRPSALAFEPGSVFKVFSLSAMLELGGVNVHDSFFCDGEYKNDGFAEPIRDIIPHGRVTVREIIKYSCNVGAALASETVAARDLHDLLTKFGFGKDTLLPIPGESSGLLADPTDWSARTKPTIAFGQEISVTALQIVTAATAFANDGVVLVPRIVKKVLSPNGQVINENVRQEASSVISQRTAQDMLHMMESSTDIGGTAFRAKIEGVRIAAKTGTAQVFDPQTSSYSTKKYIASALAIFPVSDPKLIVYVVIEHPRGDEYYGGRIAAPTLREIADEAIVHLEIQRDSQQ